ncbi:hypothetical protein [Aeoliella sp.]|uniref:hypothetical protein n=1 Tax=Aeoliella sp. TaxID=2795800 RepID=UPI003CCC0B6C
MAILIQRFRLRFVWLLTGHPRFRPLYHRDVVSPDPLEQAEFLANAGYYVAAVMLARVSVESQVRRYAMITKNWTDFKRRHTVEDMAKILLTHKRIGKTCCSQIARFYALASSIAHGRPADLKMCLDVLHLGYRVVQQVELSRQLYLKGSLPVAMEGGAACQLA